MKLKFLFLLIILYLIAGFGWWSYSLIQFSNNEYKLKNQLLISGKQTAELKLVEEARSNRFISEVSDTFLLNDIFITIDTAAAKNFVIQKFKGSYLLKYNTNTIPQKAVVVINDAILDRYQMELQAKKRSFTLEAILLTLLIGAGIFGVYFSVSFLFDLNKQQNNFLLSVTHELKTPIAAIKLIGETMKRRVLPPEKQEELMGNILENAERLQDMTENMLTAMQMENNKYSIRKEEINLSQILIDISKNFALKTEINQQIEDDIQFYGDPILLKMTFNNLIENAIKYSNNLPIDINLYNRNDQIVIEIKDRGIGIDKAYRKKIFKKFYRIEDDETRETKGSGLGLFIVKQAVQKHKGSIEISQNSPQGTIFTIYFHPIA